MGLFPLTVVYVLNRFTGQVEFGWFSRDDPKKDQNMLLVQTVVCYPTFSKRLLRCVKRDLGISLYLNHCATYVVSNVLLGLNSSKTSFSS